MTTATAGATKLPGTTTSVGKKSRGRRVVSPPQQIIDVGKLSGDRVVFGD